MPLIELVLLARIEIRSNAAQITTTTPIANYERKPEEASVVNNSCGGEKNFETIP